MWGCAGVLPLEHSQVGDVFGEVAGDAGQLLVGAVHDGALAAAPVWAHEVHEALAAEPAAVILRAWGAKEGCQHHQPGPGQGCGDGGYGWGGLSRARGSTAFRLWAPGRASRPSASRLLASLWSLSFNTFRSNSTSSMCS